MPNQTHRLVPPSLLLLTLAAFLCRSTASAHTLPISYLTVVPDKDYLHLELVLNPFELNFFSEIDTNHNGRLDPAELAGQEKNLTRHLLNCLRVRANGKLVRAETAGVTPDLDSHHLTLRAHYRMDALRTRLTVESKLNTITSGSHITHVRFGKPGHIQSAQLDMQSATVTFEPAEPQAPSVSAPADPRKAVTRSTP
ncbi:MAG: hypothetical protein ACYDH9_25390 [Limisphaerales bacterium]